MTDPATISGLTSWFKADAITGLSDGNPVASWTNSASGGAAATQSSSGAKPTYQTGEINALPVVRFDGGDWLSSTTNCVNTSNGATTVFVVLKPASGYVVIADTAGADAFQYGLGGSGAQEILKASAASLGASSTAVPTSGFSICSVSHTNSGTYLFELDGTADGTGTASQSLTAASGTRIGADASGSFGIAADIAEIIIYTTVLSSTDRDGVTDYLATKYDLGGSTPPSGGGTAGDRTVYATNPPSGSGLTAVTTGGSTSQTANLQAQLDYVASEWGGGTVVGAGPATIVCDTGLDIPEKVQLRDATLAFGGLASGTAITVDDTKFTPLVDVTLHGPNTNSGRTITGPSGTIALDVHGSRLSFRNLYIDSFRTGIDVANEDTFILDFTGGVVEVCQLGVNADLAAAGTSNAGEGIKFSDMTFANSVQIFKATASGLSLFFDKCSLDYSVLYGYIDEAYVFINNSHLESIDRATSDGQPWGSENGYLFNLVGNPKFQVSNSRFQLGGDLNPGQLNRILNPATGPANYGNGRARFENCSAFFYDSTTASGIKSQPDTFAVTIPNAQTSVAVTFYSPFLSKWSPVTARVVANDFLVESTASSVRAWVTGLNHTTGAIAVTVNGGVANTTYFIRLEY